MSVEDFQCCIALEVGMLSQIDRSCAASPQQTKYTIVAQLLSNMILHMLQLLPEMRYHPLHKMLHRLHIQEAKHTMRDADCMKLFDFTNYLCCITSNEMLVGMALYFCGVL